MIRIRIESDAGTPEERARELHDAAHTIAIAGLGRRHRRRTETPEERLRAAIIAAGHADPDLRLRIYAELDAMHPLPSAMPGDEHIYDTLDRLDAERLEAEIAAEAEAAEAEACIIPLSGR